MKKLIPALLAAILLAGCASQTENSKPAPATLSTTAATTTAPEMTESDSTELPEFYDNTELCGLAEEYYECHNGERPPAALAISC